MNQKVTITMSYEDYLEANRLRIRSRWTVVASARFIALTTILYAVIISFGEVADNGLSVQTLFVCLLMGLMVGLCAYVGIRLWLLWCIPRSARKLYSEQPSASAPYVFSFDAQGMSAEGKFETSNLPWSHVKSWMESERLLVLEKTSITFFCLPKAQLGEESLADLKQCLATAGVKRGLSKV
ncbi:MAG: hypothetical protein B7Y36_02475 [Novosphingobium sp. 28-62-57]|uniref:YcxB family protein n=1 Tax=unclassified Novosphingobium TaxID=2644732 RepID=UPI000BD0E5C3|nr:MULTISPECIES: YcxB family protein [unclassified Novosphingobium]OYW49634.1 MAG: hypothetical protein B7Z34_08135 [Novosphingobium sp. 12-62-10]OYZ12409.1 MAG: hypothetical protein B7Y36_02475 [Novosphingobium sp. 28-62-57]OZA34117.1 MAG: hypothetical protein B7X92_10720 [Novosphingobium sp. 17-62-9]HQS69536.1 YcxB family protein [Novosphingobium sp.]